MTIHSSKAENLKILLKRVEDDQYHQSCMLKYRFSLWWHSLDNMSVIKKFLLIQENR